MKTDYLNMLVIGVGRFGRHLAFQALSELDWVDKNSVLDRSSQSFDREKGDIRVPFSLTRDELNHAQLLADGFAPVFSQISFVPLDINFLKYNTLLPSGKRASIEVLHHKLLTLRPQPDSLNWFPIDLYPEETLSYDWFTPALYRAVFLAFQNEIMRDCLRLNSPSNVTHIKIVSGPGGKGSTWLGDIADFAGRQWPTALIDLIFTECSRFPKGGSFVECKYALRSLIALEETETLVQQLNASGELRYSLRRLSCLTSSQSDAGHGHDVVLSALKTLLRGEVSLNESLTKESLTNHLEGLASQFLREMAGRNIIGDVREHFIAKWGLRTRSNLFST